MVDFKRRRKESASEWRMRLAGLDTSALTPLQLDELTLRRVQAERALRRGRRRGVNGEAMDAARPDGSPALVRCMQHARELSADERRRLIHWLESCFVD